MLLHPIASFFSSTSRQMRVQFCWLMLPTYHKRLQATNSNQRSSSVPEQMCRGKIGETPSTKVWDGFTQCGCSWRISTFSSSKLARKLTLRLVCSAFDRQQPPKRRSARLRVQTHLHNSRLSPAALPRTTVCMYWFWFFHFSFFLLFGALNTNHCFTSVFSCLFLSVS